MTLDPNTGSIITQTEAENLVKEFDVAFPNEIISSFIGKNNITTILSQEDCIGIRIYNGYDPVTKTIKLILVGVNSSEEDLLADGIIYDHMAVCPPVCPVNGLYTKK